MNRATLAFGKILLLHQVVKFLMISFSWITNPGLFLNINCNSNLLEGSDSLSFEAKILEFFRGNFLCLEAQSFFLAKVGLEFCFAFLERYFFSLTF